MIITSSLQRSCLYGYGSIYASKVIKSDIPNMTNQSNLTLEVSVKNFICKFEILNSNSNFQSEIKIFTIPVRQVFQNKAPMTVFVSHSSSAMLKFPTLDFKDSSKSWYFHLKFALKVKLEFETFKIKLKHQIYKGMIYAF